MFEPDKNSEKPAEEIGGLKLLAIYLLSFVSGCSMGIFNPLVSAYLKEFGVSEILIGANSTVYFSMLVLGAPVAMRLLRVQTHKKVIVAGLTLTALSAFAFPLCSELWAWFAVRMLSGCGVCLYMIGGQSLLNSILKEENRNLVNGIYCLMFGLGFGAGPVMGAALYAFEPAWAFWSVAVILLLAVGFTFLWLPSPIKEIEQVEHSAAVATKLRRPLSAIFAYGFTEATLMTVFPLFLIAYDADVQQIGYTFGMFVLGNLIFTLPITWLADRWGVRPMLVIMLIVGLLTIGGLVMQDQVGWQLYLLGALAGASLGVVYPLAMSFVGKIVHQKELSAGMSLFTLFFGLGCTFGPIVSSATIRFSGINHVFTPSLIIIMLVLVIVLINTIKENLEPYENAS